MENFVYVLNLTDEERDFLRDFFTLTEDFIENNDLTNPNKIDEFINIYKNCLDNSSLKSSDILNSFIDELESSKMYFIKYNNSLHTRLLRNAQPLNSNTKCKNSTINKWREHDKQVRCVNGYAAQTELTKNLKPKIEHNKHIKSYSHENADRSYVK